MGLRGIFKRRRTDDEAARRQTLLRAGRIAEGSVFDIITDERTGAITQIFYNYEFNGVEYESSQLLDAGQRQRSADYFPGARVTVRFNPRQPGNSVVV